jgi:hypothetical protein
MSKKQPGICPFCKETQLPVVVVENIFRRDKCECSSCKETIYVCRSPGCENFAKGGDVYDDELCPECTRGVVSNSAMVVVTVAGTLLAGLASAATSKND